MAQIWLKHGAIVCVNEALGIALMVLCELETCLRELAHLLGGFSHLLLELNHPHSKRVLSERHLVPLKNVQDEVRVDLRVVNAIKHANIF